MTPPDNFMGKETRIKSIPRPLTCPLKAFYHFIMKFSKQNGKITYLNEKRKMQTDEKKYIVYKGGRVCH